MKKLFLFIVCLFAFGAFAIAQEETEYDYQTSKKRDNYYSSEKYDDGYDTKFFRQWYIEPYVGAGFIFGDLKDNAAELVYGESYNVDFGFKWRYQIAKRFGLVFNTDFIYNRYQIKDGIQNDIFNFQMNFDPSYVIHSERYRSWALGLGIGGRVNLGTLALSNYNGYFKKAGKYVELLAYGNYNFSRYYNVEFYGTSDLKAELHYKDPSLFFPFDAGLQLSLGWNWFSVWARYRLTECLHSDYSDAKLPPFSAGLAINFGPSKL